MDSIPLMKNSKIEPCCDWHIPQSDSQQNLQPDLQRDLLSCLICACISALSFGSCLPYSAAQSPTQSASRLCAFATSASDGLTGSVSCHDAINQVRPKAFKMG